MGSGFDAYNPAADVPELLEDLRRLYWRGVHSAGGLSVRQLDSDRVSGSKSESRPPTPEPAKAARELEQVVDKLRAELLRIRRVYWSELIEPLPEDRPGGADARMRQLERVRTAYPNWPNELVAIAECLNVRDVREARRNGRAHDASLQAMRGYR